MQQIAAASVPADRLHDLVDQALAQQHPIGQLRAVEGAHQLDRILQRQLRLDVLADPRVAVAV